MGQKIILIGRFFGTEGPLIPTFPRMSIKNFIVTQFPDIVRLLGSLAWPGTVLTGLLIFKKTIIKKFDSMTEGKAGPVEAKFAAMEKIGVEILKVDNEAKPVQEKLEQAKEALERNEGQTEDSRKLLTEQLIRSTETISQLEAEKKSLIEKLMLTSKNSWKATTVSNFVDFIHSVQPTEASSIAYKNMLAFLIEQVGIETVLNTSMPILAKLVKKEIESLRDGIDIEKLRSLLTMAKIGVLDDRLNWFYRHLCGRIFRPPQWNRIAVL